MNTVSAIKYFYFMRNQNPCYVPKTFTHYFLPGIYTCRYSTKKIQYRNYFPDPSFTKDVSVSYDNGKQEISVKTEFINGKLFVTDTFYSKYAAIIIYRKNETWFPYTARFFLTEKPAKIIFQSIDKTHNSLVFTGSGFQDIAKLGGDQLHYYDSAIENDFHTFGIANEPNMAKGDSMTFVRLNEKSQALAGRKLSFIKAHPTCIILSGFSEENWLQIFYNRPII